MRMNLFGKKKTVRTEGDKFEILHRQIMEEIKHAITPKFIDLSPQTADLVDLAVEIWRVEQRIAKSASSIPEIQLKGLDNSILKMRRFLEKSDIEVIDYKDTKYNEGLNLDILSIEKDPTIQTPQVKEVVEPTILCKGQVVRKAKIILLTNK